MAVLSHTEVIEKIKNRFGDNMSDEDFELVADISDTLNANDSENWKQKYEENDSAWRKKYRDRFNSGTSEDKEEEVEETNKPKNYNELFKEE